MINTYVKPSPIHGLGLFAAKSIKKGEKIVQGAMDFSKDIDEWIKYNKSGLPPSFAYEHGYCMMNHSEYPNTERCWGRIIKASKEIKKDEEITEDYYKLPDDENPFRSFDLQKILFQIKHSLRHYEYHK